jgi:hypothetical protein
MSTKGILAATSGFGKAAFRSCQYGLIHLFEVARPLYAWHADEKRCERQASMCIDVSARIRFPGGGQAEFELSELAVCSDVSVVENMR